MLLTLDAAAQKMGVPRAALRKEAERHGLLVRFGRAVRIDENTIPELIEKCRNEPKARAYTGTNQGAVGSSETQADQRLLRAQMTAQLLKKPSRSTSQPETPQSARPRRMT